MPRRCTTRPGHGARPGSSACRARRCSSEAPVRLRMGDASVDSSEAAAGSCHGSAERRDRPRRRVAIMDTPRTCRQWWKTEIRGRVGKKESIVGATAGSCVWSCRRPFMTTATHGVVSLRDGRSSFIDAGANGVSRRAWLPRRGRDGLQLGPRRPGCDDQPFAEGLFSGPVSRARTKSMCAYMVSRACSGARARIASHSAKCCCHSASATARSPKRRPA